MRSRVLALALCLSLTITPLLSTDYFVEEVVADSFPSWTRVFHLHEGAVRNDLSHDWMNSSGPYAPSYIDYDDDGKDGVTIKKWNPSQRWRFFWILDPVVSRDVDLIGDLSAYIWAKSENNNSASMITVKFSDLTPPANWANPNFWTMTEIASVTIPLEGPVYSTAKQYNLTATGISYTIPSGHYLIMTVQRGDSENDSLWVLYDQPFWDSRIVLTTTTFIEVDELWTENTSGILADTFSDVEQVVVRANVSNPFGAYEIEGADLQVAYSSNGTPVIADVPMSVYSGGPPGSPWWVQFTASLAPLANGSYTLTVYARDPQGAPSWLQTMITIVTVDHFGVAAPPNITAGSPFSMTITALDSVGNTVAAWIGTVSLSAFKSDFTTPGTGALMFTTAAFNSSDLGQITLPGQQYDFAEEVIVIRVASGGHVGWSGMISVAAGPIANVQISPPGSLALVAGNTATLTAKGTDILGNENTSWTPFWAVVGAIGTIQGAGFSVAFLATTAGNGSVRCSDPVTGRNATVNVSVSVSSLYRIQISPSGPLTIREGRSVALTATGYDAYDNVVSIANATWYTTTSGSVSGSGPSATYTAGFIPETGAVYVDKDGRRGSVNVSVINAADGPWLSTIPVQIGVEDTTWTLSLSNYWHHANGTSSLEWYAVGVNQSLYIVARNPSSNALMEFIPQPDEFGDDTFTLWVRDPKGFSTYLEVTVSIQSVNDRPKFEPTPPATLYVRFNLPYTFDYTYYVKDVDTPKSDLVLSSSLPGNVYFNGLQATFTFADTGNSKSYFQLVTITLSDGMSSTSINVVVWVTDDHPPSLSMDLPDVTIWEGDVRVFVFDLDDYFYDLDDDYLVYSSGFEYVDVEINETTHEVFMSALSEWSGVDEGIFMAEDPVGALKADTVLVTVIAVNDNPMVTSPGTVHLRFDEPYYLDMMKYVSDPDNAIPELTVTFSDSHVDIVTSPKYQIELLYPANLTGPIFTEAYRVSVTMTVTDPQEATGSCTFTVFVSDNYPPGLLDPLRPNFFSFLEDGYLNGSINFDELFWDSDDTTLFFNISSSSNPSKLLWTIYPDGTVNLTAAPNWYGTETLTFEAKDEHDAWASWMATIYVVPVNDPPVVLPIPDLIKKGGSRTIQYYIRPFISDIETNYSQLMITVEPGDSVVVVGDYLYITLPDGVNILTVRLRVSDGDAESSEQEFEVGIKKSFGEIIGWPYSLPFMILAAAVGGYFFYTRMPKPYKVENVFLIHNDGRLIAHVAEEENTNLDQDVISAMFTAVQEFVRDSFQKGEIGLKKLEIGDKNVTIEKGKSVYVAMIYSGRPPKEVFDSLAVLLRDVEERFRGRIERWNGTMKTLKGVDKMILEYMGNAYKPGSWTEEEEISEEQWVDILSKES